MPASYRAEHFTSHLKIWSVDFDPDLDTPVVVDLGQPQGAGLKLIPIARLRRLLIEVFKSVGTGNTDECSIIAATNAAGTGSPTVVDQIATAIAQTQNAVGDVLVLEVDVDQIREVLPTATHVGARLELATATDEMVVTAIAEYMDQAAGLSANYIA